MIKKQFTLPLFISLLLIILLFIIAIVAPEYSRYFMYFSIIIMIPVIIYDLIKKRKEDNRNGTQFFKFSIYNILISILIMGFLFFLISQNYTLQF